VVNVSTYIDSIGATSGNIPADAPMVGVYVSGEGDVPWDSAEEARFQGSRINRIYQGAGNYPGVGGYDMIDVETGAVTPAQCASEIEKRAQNHFDQTIVYATDGNLEAVSAAIAASPGEPLEHEVLCFLADWNLNEAEAEAKLGTIIHGMACVGVQWASPSSNPNTICPGTEKNLKQLNVDLSVVDASVMPIDKLPVSMTPPPGPSISGLIVYDAAGGAFTSKSLTSNDGGRTWS
jgi:hypothetical protein